MQPLRENQSNEYFLVTDSTVSTLSSHERALAKMCRERFTYVIYAAITALLPLVLCAEQGN